MKKQYIVQKYVMADSVAEALRKSKKIPIHEIYVHSAWWEKTLNSCWFLEETKPIGLKNPK